MPCNVLENTNTTLPDSVIPPLPHWLSLFETWEVVKIAIAEIVQIPGEISLQFRGVSTRVHRYIPF